MDARLTQSGPRASRSGETARFLILVSFLVICLLGGGGSRPDILSLLYVRPAAVLCLAALMLAPGKPDWRAFRAPLLLLAAFAAVIAIQLIPLPPSLWLSLPGHEQFAAAGVSDPQPWRPLSLTPDLTLGSLISILPPLAVLVGVASINQDQRCRLLPLLILAAFLSALLGAVQLSSGRQSPLFLYEITHRGSAVGFFANRNHQAALLAMTLPMLRAWTLMPATNPQRARARFWVSAAFGCFLIPMILVTGSRAGMFLAVVGVLAAFLLTPRARSKEPSPDRWRRMRAGLWLLAPLSLALVALFFGRAVAIERLYALSSSGEAEGRWEFMPEMVKIVRDFFPFGTGFGSFDRVFRVYERDTSLSEFYFNRAHNEPIEVLLTGGVPAVVVVVLFLLWWGSRTRRAFAKQTANEPPILLARLGSVMILMMCLASLVDYPLRTPLMASCLAIACGWLSSTAINLNPRASGGGRAVES